MDIEFLQKIYSVLKVEYKYSGGKKYYVFGFKDGDNEWDINKGELIYVTSKDKEIKELKEKIFTISEEELICKQCFRNKNLIKIRQKPKFWGFSIWDGLTEENLLKLQNLLLLFIEDFSWANVRGVTESKEPFVYFNFCDECLDQDQYNHNENFQEYRKVISSNMYKLAAETVIDGNEKVLEKYIADHIEIIEPGLTLIESQKSIKGGVIDILAMDKNKKICIIELKTVDNDKDIVWQSAYYQSQFNENVRVITIAPNYTEAIYCALSRVKNVELKKYTTDSKGYLTIVDFNKNSIPSLRMKELKLSNRQK